MSEITNVDAWIDDLKADDEYHQNAKDCYQYFLDNGIEMIKPLRKLPTTLKTESNQSE